MMCLSKLALSSSCRFEGSSGRASAGTVAMSLTLARSSSVEVQSRRVSVGLFGVGIPVIERAPRGDALEFTARMREAGGAQQFPDSRVIALAHGFDARIGTERAHLAAHVEHGLVKRVTRPVTRIAADHHAAGLRHEGRETA